MGPGQNVIIHCILCNDGRWCVPLGSESNCNALLYFIMKKAEIIVGLWPVKLSKPQNIVQDYPFKITWIITVSP